MIFEGCAMGRGEARLWPANLSCLAAFQCVVVFAMQCPESFCMRFVTKNVFVCASAALWVSLLSLRITGICNQDPAFAVHWISSGI